MVSGGKAAYRPVAGIHAFGYDDPASRENKLEKIDAKKNFGDSRPAATAEIRCGAGTGLCRGGESLRGRGKGIISGGSQIRSRGCHESFLAAGTGNRSGDGPGSD